MQNKARRIDTYYIKQYQETKKQEFFEEIYDFYKNPLYYFCCSYVKNAAIAEEIIQETFISVIQNIGTLRDPEAFHAWIYRICYTKTMNYYRKEKKYLLSDEYEEENSKLIGKNQVSDKIGQQELLKQIEGSIDELDENLQHVMMLYYFSEFKIKEISNILDIPEGTVKTRLKRAKEELQGLLVKKDVTPESYLSFGLPGLLFKSFEESSEKYQMSNQTSQKILKEVTQSSLKTKRMSKAITSIVGITLVLSYFFVPSSHVIQSVSYYEEWTRKNIEVSVLLDKSVDDKDIHILKNNEELDYSRDDNVIKFIADENDEYQIKVKSDQENIKIDKIDKESPLLTQADHLDNKMTLSIEDIGIGIDYTKSYALYKNEKLVINEDGTIDGTFEEDIDVYLYDQLDNYSQYKVEL